MKPEHKLSEIRQIAITVSDVSTALPFYRDVLGLTFLFSPTPTIAFLAAGTVRIMLSTSQGAGTIGHNSILYFTATDITVTHAAIVERGAKNERTPALAAKMPDHELWTGFVRDPGGNLLVSWRRIVQEKFIHAAQPFLKNWPRFCILSFVSSLHYALFGWENTI